MTMATIPERKAVVQLAERACERAGVRLHFFDLGENESASTGELSWGGITISIKPGAKILLFVVESEWGLKYGIQMDWDQFTLEGLEERIYRFAVDWTKGPYPNF